VNNAQSTGGGVIYRNGPNDYVDGQGNPVKISSDGTVTGYKPTSTGGTGGSASAGSGEPAEPVNPNPASEPAGSAPGSGDTGGDGGGDPADPGDPDPFIDPFP
jgi:hypothetical protein